MGRVSVLGSVVAVLVLVGAACTSPPPPSPPPGSVATITVQGQLVTVGGPDGSTVAVASSDQAGLPPTPAGFEFPIGALDITIGNVTAGSVAEVTISLEEAVDSVHKLIGGVWDSFATDGTTGATVSPDGLTVTLLLQDGGRGDNDATADGVIHDPVAPSKSTSLHHVTIWESDVAYADTLPAIVDWVGYGSFAYNQGMGGCNMLDGGAGWTKSFTRVDSQTVHVRLTLDWFEGDNGVDGYGCGVNDVLNVGLLDSGGTEVAFALISLVSNT